MAQFFRRMKFLDTIYYSIYRFGRSIRQPEFSLCGWMGILYRTGVQMSVIMVSASIF